MLHTWSFPFQLLTPPMYNHSAVYPHHHGGYASPYKLRPPRSIGRRPGCTPCRSLCLLSSLCSLVNHRQSEQTSSPPPPPPDNIVLQPPLASMRPLHAWGSLWHLVNMLLHSSTVTGLGQSVFLGIDTQAWENYYTTTEKKINKMVSGTTICFCVLEGQHTQLSI